MRLIARALLFAISWGAGLSFIAIAPAHAKTGTCQPTGEGTERHGLLPIIQGALAGLGLEGEQKTLLREIEARAESAELLANQAKEKVLLALADGLEKGQIELSAMKPEVTTYVAARQEWTRTLRAVLLAIHDVLDPVERTKFANSFEQRFTSEAELSLSPRWLDVWSGNLRLSEEQKKKVRAVFESERPSLSAEIERFDRALTAFKGEQFSLAEVVPLKLDPLFALENALRMVNTTSKISAILTPEQRAHAAEMLRKRVCEPKTPAPTYAYDFPYSGGFGMIR